MNTTSTYDEEIVLSADVQLEPAPEGRQPAICVDVISLGEEEETWNGKNRKVRKLAIVWQVFPEDGERDSNDCPFLIDVQVTASINDGAKLRLSLESWEGRGFTSLELKSLSIGGYKGRAAYLNIIQLVKNGFIYTQIQEDVRDNDPTQRKFYKIEPYNGKAIKAEPKHYDRQTIVRKYERMKEGKVAKASQSSSQSTPGGQANAKSKDDFVPF